MGVQRLGGNRSALRGMAPSLLFAAGVAWVCLILARGHAAWAGVAFRVGLAAVALIVALTGGSRLSAMTFVQKLRHPSAPERARIAVLVAVLSGVYLAGTA